MGMNLGMEPGMERLMPAVVEPRIGMERVMPAVVEPGMRIERLMPAVMEPGMAAVTVLGMTAAGSCLLWMLTKIMML